MIKFLDLQKINALYKDELQKVANDVIESGWYLLGEKVEEFERSVSQYTGSPNIVVCANGLDALRLIIRAYKEMGIMKDGDEIIVPANTYIATILAITDNNLIPVMVEPDEKTYNLDISKVESHITRNTKAIMVVHLYGMICWSSELERIASKYSLKIIEDNAQAIGARWIDGRMSGNLGDAAGFSFYPGKNLGALGDGGAVSTKEPELAKIVRSLANYGSSKKYINDFQGLNSRMDEIQAAFLTIKLKYLDHDNNKRREIAKYYCENIKNSKIILPYNSNSHEQAHVWHIFVVRSKNRDNLQKYLYENDIQTLIHYPVPPYMQKCYQKLSHLNLPLTALLSDECLSLPISPVLCNYEMEQVTEVLSRW
jgi:dTDP-4-amino-4,6-dideoxygalactose transaminase